VENMRQMATKQELPQERKQLRYQSLKSWQLRNVDANYSFESSRRFPGSQSNSSHRDHSRLSCSAGDTQLGLGSAGIFSKRFCTKVGHHAASPMMRKRVGAVPDRRP
jgi:hypothetical protein